MCATEEERVSSSESDSAGHDRDSADSDSPGFQKVKRSDTAEENSGFKVETNLKVELTSPPLPPPSGEYHTDSTLEVLSSSLPGADDVAADKKVSVSTDLVEVKGENIKSMKSPFIVPFDRKEHGKQDADEDARFKQSHFRRFRRKFLKAITGGCYRKNKEAKMTTAACGV